MHRAKGDAVGFIVRTACLVPFYVGRFHGNQRLAKPYIEAAYRASVFIRAQYALPETGVSDFARGYGRFDINPHGLEDILMNGGWKAVFQENAGYLS